VSSASKFVPNVGGCKKQPKYQQVKMHLQNQIRSGVFSPGTPLPKERELAVSLDVAAGTLRQALQELEADGLIRRVRGQGTFATTFEERRSQVRASLFSLIVPQVREGLYPSVIHGFEQAVVGTRYQITVGNSCNELMRQEELLRQAIDGNVSGVAVVPATFPPSSPEQFIALQQNRVPLVFCHRPVEGVAAPLVTWSGNEVGRMTARTLLEQGHRRIATIVAFRDPKVNELTTGIQQAMKESGLDSSAYTVRYHGERLPGIHARQAIHDVLKELLASEDRPTAIHCANLPDAEQVYMLADEMGLSIPEDLSLIYFGDSRRTGGLAQRLTCVAVEAEAIGLRAGKVLEEILSGGLSPTATDRFEVPLTSLPGETVCSPSI